MKVLQIHNKYLNYGGEDTVVENEYLLLKNNAVDVEQLFFENSKINLLQLAHNKDSYNITNAKIKEFQPDIIHVHNIFYKASSSVLVAAKNNNIPVVITFHNYRAFCANGLFLRDSKVCLKCKDLIFPTHGIYNKCFQDSYSKSAILSLIIGLNKKKNIWNEYVDKIIVLTPFIKGVFLNSNMGFSENKIVVKPNSTDDFIENSPIQNTDKDYLFVGRLSKEKGIDVLVEAFNKLPNIKIHVVGDGDLRQDLERIANDNIIFHGIKPREFIKNQLAKSRALIFPSIWYEGLPNTIIEAFSSGTPVIASDISNINQIIDNTNNGILFETGNPTELKKTVQKFSAFQIEEISKYKKKARQTYQELYSHKINFKNLMSIYSELI